MHFLTTILGSLAAIILLPSTAHAWLFAHEGQQATAVAVSEDGDVFSAGSITTSGELVVMSHGSGDGSEQWRYLLAASPLDRRHVSLAQDVSGAVFAAGRYEVGRNGPFVGHVVKLAPENGQEHWRVELTDVGIYAIAVDPLGDLVLAGALRGLGGVTTQDLLVIKLDGVSGEEVWRHVVNGLADGADLATSVVINEGGEIAIGGSVFDNVDLGYSDFVVVQLSGVDGSENWRAKVPSIAGHGGRVEALTLDAEDNVVAAGQAVTGGGWCDWVVAKFRPSDGAQLWRAVFDGGGCDNALDVGVDDAGDIVATGGQGLTLFVTIKFSGVDGSMVWRHDIENLGQCNGGNCALGEAVRVVSNGDAIVIGKDPIGDIIVARLAADDGHELWRRVIDYQGCSDRPHAVATNDAGDVAISGRASELIGGVCTGNLYIVTKLNGSDGSDFTAPICGNGTLESGESCDDGNPNDGDGCSALCDSEFCGDGMLQPALGEQCDDGNQSDGDGCSMNCQFDLDGDGVPDAVDNCPDDFNPDQEDLDGDAVGDHCDPFPDDPDNDLAQALADLADTQQELAATQEALTQAELDLAQCEAELSQCLNPPTICNDGIDNDGDGRTDFPDDRQCMSPEQGSERIGACGLGFELSVLLPAIMLVHRRRRRGATGG
jgi:cysteine-rich repeat protein